MTSVPRRGKNRPILAADTRGNGTRGRLRRWPGALVAVAAVLAAYAAVALVGRAQDARGERVLPVFDPAVAWIRNDGVAFAQWLQAHRVAVGIGATVAVAAVAAAGRVAGPLLLATAVIGLAGWAQVALQSNRTTLGTGLYLAAIAAGFALGIWRPLRSLPGIPAFPPTPPAPPADAARARRAWRRECGLVAALTVLALLLRSYALTELYDFFDLETIVFMVQGRTWKGFLGYLDFGFVQNNGGAVQLLPPQLIFRLFGTSIFTLRMNSVLWGIAAVPLMYTFVRRIAGIPGAVAGALLIVTAPEQLFWGRNENLFFAPVAVCALLTAHLSLWMVQRFSLAAVVATMLWMPWCRWFYSACMVAFLIPLTAAAHAMLCARGLWRRAWWVVPLLALGLAGWIFSLSAKHAALHDWEWKFIDPTAVYGSSAWRKQGEFRDATIPDLIRLQAVSMSVNFAAAARAMTYHVDNFSHWCQRAQPPFHRTTINVGIMILVWPALGYLLAQIADRRAFLLLAWWGIALLPGIMSADPAERRMAMFFPASHAIAGVMIAALLAIVRSAGGRLAARIGTAVASVGLAAIAITNLVSHFTLPIAPVLYGDQPRFAAPLFQRSDAIITNLPEPFRMLVLLGNLDRFLDTPPCIRYVEPRDWLNAALDPGCDFSDLAFRVTMPPERVEQLRAAYHPRRLSFLFFEDRLTQPTIDLVRALYPHAEVQRHESPRGDHVMVALTVDADDVAALHRPSVSSDGAPQVPPPRILDGIDLSAEGDPPAAAPAGAVVQGGVLVGADGWYRWRVEPACERAVLSIDGAPVGDGARPMLAGVHPFSLALPDLAACPLPLHLVVRSETGGTERRVPADQILSRQVVSVPGAAAAPVVPYEGYGPPAVFAEIRGRAAGFGVDAHGDVSVLVNERGVWHVHRYDRAGREQATWQPQVPRDAAVASFAVAPDGSSAILASATVFVHDRDGQPVARWQHSYLVWESALQFWGPDLIVANIHHRDSLVVFNRTGALLQEWSTFAGGPGKLFAPMALSISSAGQVLVEQLDGVALSFQLDGPAFAPQFRRQFVSGSALHGAAFDGPDRVVVPDLTTVRVYDGNGERSMATEPARDLSQQPFGAPVRIAAAPGQLLVLDPERNRLWTIRR